MILKKFLSKEKAILISSLTEPVGTVLVGGTISWFILDPFTRKSMQVVFTSILALYYGWLISSISGCVLGAIIVLALNRIGVLKLVFGE